MAFETGSFFYAIFVCAERVLYDSSVWDIPRRSHCSLSTNDNPTKLNWQSMSKFMANVWLSILIVSMVQYIFHYKRICRIDLHVVWLWKTHKPQYHSGRFLFQLCTRALPHHLPPFHRSNEHNQFQHHTKFIQLENRLKHLFHVRQFLSFGDVACDIRNPDGCSQVTSQSFKSNWQSGIQSCVWVDRKKKSNRDAYFHTVRRTCVPTFRRLACDCSKEMELRICFVYTLNFEEATQYDGSFNFQFAYKIDGWVRQVALAVVCMNNFESILTAVCMHCKLCPILILQLHRFYHCG